jgi:hypothetical protein
MSFSFLGDFQNGVTLVLPPNASMPLVMSSRNLSRNYDDKEAYTPTNIFAANGYSEGLIFARGAGGDVWGYYDLNGLVIGFPEYAGRQFNGAPFRGGYAVMSVTGVDRANYITAIDKAGNRLYEPIKAGADINESSHGYVLATTVDGRVVICPDGAILKLGVDDLSVIGNGISFGEISNGFILMNNQYISLDGRTIIDSVTIQTEAPVVEERIIPPSTYTGSFDMVGMWRSGSGTILSFNSNGTVGPMFFGFEDGPDGSWSISARVDENGHYTLQASHLTGGNPIYKVRLLSKDEIELYEESGVGFGRSYYKLERQ